MTPLHLFLGGHDLEMATIADFAREKLPAGHLHDKHLAWGAKASAYLAGIEAALASGARAGLVELADDLPAALDRARMVVLDHHGALAGAERPCALRQVFDLLGRPEAEWTRHFALVAANDTGHMRGLRAMGASAEEIRLIRDADRRAQGVTAEEEAQARAALAAMRRRGALAVVRLPGERTSAAGDFCEPEYGGPGVAELLVLTPGAAHFFGSGAVVLALQGRAGSWSGGALPQRGFWGAPVAGAAQAALEAEIVALLGGA